MKERSRTGKRVRNWYPCGTHGRIYENKNPIKSLILLVIPAGIEPATYSLGTFIAVNKWRNTTEREPSF
ncbi:MAG: hypothetical protein ABL907_23765 [Hyphomicrobium sp.]